jgi:NADP-dependent 3-hydroxy acid dehydrogenase YdfG
MNQQPLIVVSGGSKGIGKAIIKRFAASGFRIAAFARNIEFLAALEKELKSNGCHQLLLLQADASNKESIQQFTHTVLEKMGTPDILVNNAGIFKPGQLLNEEDDTLELLLKTNVASAYHLTRGIVPSMKKNNKGHVFNICSTASITPYINGGSYCISKFALFGMSKVLREELKETFIRVTSVLPGATLTDSWEGSNLPQSRFMQAEDIAEAIWNAYSMKSGVVEELLIRPQLGDI